MIATSRISSVSSLPGYNIDTAESGCLVIQSDCVYSYARQMVACFHVQHSNFIATDQVSILVQRILADTVMSLLQIKHVPYPLLHQAVIHDSFRNCQNVTVATTGAAGCC